jgi:hypothetical protein
MALLSILSIVTLASTVSGQTAGNWPTFRDGGVEVSHPPGWTVNRDVTTGRLTVQGGPTVRLVIWPFFVDGALDAATAGRVLARMAKSRPHSFSSRLRPPTEVVTSENPSQRSSPGSG